MDIIGVQEYPRKRCAPSSPLEDSILHQQPKRSCSSEYYLLEMSNSYRVHDISAGSSILTLARKTTSPSNEEQMECCSDSSGQSENNNNDSALVEPKKHMESSKDACSRPQHKNSIHNLHVSSSFRRNPVKCHRCFAGEPGHFNHLTS